MPSRSDPKSTCLPSGVQDQGKSCCSSKVKRRGVASLVPLAPSLMPTFFYVGQPFPIGRAAEVLDSAWTERKCMAKPSGLPVCGSIFTDQILESFWPGGASPSTYFKIIVNPRQGRSQPRM